MSAAASSDAIHFFLHFILLRYWYIGFHWYFIFTLNDIDDTRRLLARLLRLILHVIQLDIFEATRSDYFFLSLHHFSYFSLNRIFQQGLTDHFSLHSHRLLWMAGCHSCCLSSLSLLVRMASVIVLGWIQGHFSFSYQLHSSFQPEGFLRKMSWAPTSRLLSLNRADKEKWDHFSLINSHCRRPASPATVRQQQHHWIGLGYTGLQATPRPGHKQHRRLGWAARLEYWQYHKATELATRFRQDRYTRYCHRRIWLIREAEGFSAGWGWHKEASHASEMMPSISSSAPMLQISAAMSHDVWGQPSRRRLAEGLASCWFWYRWLYKLGWLRGRLLGWFSAASHKASYWQLSWY